MLGFPQAEPRVPILRPWPIQREPDRQAIEVFITRLWERLQAQWGFLEGVLILDELEWAPRTVKMCIWKQITVTGRDSLLYTSLGP